MGKPTQQKQKTHHRPQINNYNPYNKLELNKFHQIQSNNHHQKSKGQSLHKRKRDLERMVKHCKQKGIQIDQNKTKELQKIEHELTDRRKKYQKDQRKQFFIEGKYKNIMHIQLRKIYKKINELKQIDPIDTQQLNQWQKKARYIKNYPKKLKYVSLFPTNKPLQEKALQFQKKIMDDIEQEHKKKVQRMNAYKSQNDATISKRKQKKRKTDDFFIQEVAEEGPAEDENEDQVQEQESQN